MYALIRQSLCVLNPSLFEGLGLSVAESKSIGKRVLAADLPPLREQAAPAPSVSTLTTPAIWQSNWKRSGLRPHRGPISNWKPSSRHTSVCLQARNYPGYICGPCVETHAARALPGRGHSDIFAVDLQPSCERTYQRPLRRNFSSKRPPWKRISKCHKVEPAFYLDHFHRLLLLQPLRTGCSRAA